MFKISLQQKMPSISKAESILRYHNDRIGIPLDYDRMLEYHSYYTIKAEGIRKMILKYCFPLDYTNRDSLNDRTFLEFLERVGVTQSLLLTEAGNKLSLSEDSLMQAVGTGLYSKEICYIVEKYVEMRKCYKRISSFPGLYSKSTGVLGIGTYDKHRMIIIRPDWVPQNTGRLGTANPGTLNISSDVSDIFTVPEGYLKIEVDSGQIEPRLIQSYVIKDEQLKHCTNMYNDAYYGYVHYCTLLTDEQRRTRDLNLVPMEITPELESKRKKFKTYGNAVMYGSTENSDKDPDKDAFIKYIGGHPNRVALEREVERKVLGGQTIFHTAFGSPIDVSAGSGTKYDSKGVQSYNNHLIRCGINNPIQGTAGDLMRYSVCEADKLLTRKAPKSAIIQYVHDAGKFMLHETEYDKVIDEIKEITSYQVEDWIPIYSGVEEGVHTQSVKRFLV